VVRAHPRQRCQTAEIARVLIPVRRQALPAAPHGRVAGQTDEDIHRLVVDAGLVWPRGHVLQWVAGERGLLVGGGADEGGDARGEVEGRAEGVVEEDCAFVREGFEEREGSGGGAVVAAC